MSDPRPTSDLAADVRAGLVRAFDPDAKLRLPNPAALAALSALVARITDLEAQLAKAEGWKARAEELEADYRERAVAAEAQVEKRENDARTAMGAAERFREQGIKDAERAEAAEAQVAALTQERDEYDGHLGRRMAERDDARAALATTRQALAEIAALRERWDQAGPANPFDSNEAFWDGIDIARRALAATSTTNAT